VMAGINTLICKDLEMTDSRNFSDKQ